jgi:hypothetical protein
MPDADELSGITFSRVLRSAFFDGVRKSLNKGGHFNHQDLKATTTGEVGMSFTTFV